MAAFRIAFTGIALLTAALVALPVEAQSSRNNDRRAQQDRDAKALFPNATRDVEEGRVSSRLQRRVNAMIEALNEDEKPEKAREIADEILANERANAFEKSIAAQVAGNAATDLDDTAAAIAYFERAIEENGLDNDSHYSTMQNLAITLLNEDRTEEAVALLGRLIEETRTEDAQLHYALAGAHLNAEQYAQAIAPLKRAIELDPAKAEWQQLLMQVYLEMENPTEAASVGEALLAKNPDNKRLMLTLASAYLDLEQQDKAIALLNDARGRGLLTEPRDYQMLYSLLFNADDQERQVIAVIEEGLAKGLLKRDLQTLQALAQAAYFTEDMPKAIATYKEAAALDPKGETTLNYAKVLSAEAMDAQARDAAKAAIAKGLSRPGDAWMVIARAEAQMENRAAARAALQQAAQHAETRDQANRMLSQMR